jgi:hypothetical protein
VISTDPSDADRVQPIVASYDREDRKESESSAVTDDGVRILEGNIWWDRRNYAGDYLAALLSDLDGSRTA